MRIKLRSASAIYRPQASIWFS